MDCSSAMGQDIQELGLQSLEMIPLTHLEYPQPGASGSPGYPSLTLRGEMMRLYKPLVRLAGTSGSYPRNSLLRNTFDFTMFISYQSLRLLL